MSMQEQFNKVAEEYDKNRRKFIPCFDDYYENSTAFIASAMRSLSSCQLWLKRLSPVA